MKMFHCNVYSQRHQYGGLITGTTADQALVLNQLLQVQSGNISFQNYIHKKTPILTVVHWGNIKIAVQHTTILLFTNI